MTEPPSPPCYKFSKVNALVYFLPTKSLQSFLFCFIPSYKVALATLLQILKVRALSISLVYFLPTKSIYSRLFRKRVPGKQEKIKEKGKFYGASPAERECCLLVLNLVSSTLSCIRQPRPRLRVLDVCGFV